MKKGRQERGNIDRTGKKFDHNDLLVVLMVMKRVERKLLTLSRERERYGTISVSDDSLLKKKGVFFLSIHCKKKFSDFSVPSWYITNQTNYSRPERVDNW
jgi:hypothetical protein